MLSENTRHSLAITDSEEDSDILLKNNLKFDARAYVAAAKASKTFERIKRLKICPYSGKFC